MMLHWHVNDLTLNLTRKLCDFETGKPLSLHYMK